MRVRACVRCCVTRGLAGGEAENSFLTLEDFRLLLALVLQTRLTHKPRDPIVQFATLQNVGRPGALAAHRAPAFLPFISSLYFSSRACAKGASHDTRVDQWRAPLFKRGAGWRSDRAVTVVCAAVGCVGGVAESGG